MRNFRFAMRTAVGEKVYGPGCDDGEVGIVSDEIATECVARKLGWDQGEADPVPDGSGPDAPLNTPTPGSESTPTTKKKGKAK